MPRLVAFLRAINVGGHTVTMAELRRIFTALGFKGVETFIASGNVIFTYGGQKIPALSQRIEKRLHASLGFEVVTFVRTEAEVAAIVRHRPFEAARVQQAGAFCVGLLAEPLDAQGLRTLETLKTEIDDFHVHGREVYWLCAKRQSESTFSNLLFEKTFKVRTTFRGMSTVTRLAVKYAFAPTGG
jgi:uncharacterized protein (DUF1697 family)